MQNEKGMVLGKDFARVDDRPTQPFPSRVTNAEGRIRRQDAGFSFLSGTVRAKDTAHCELQSPTTDATIRSRISVTAIALLFSVVGAAAL